MIQASKLIICREIGKLSCTELDNSPASQAGLLAGDRLVAVNGVNTVSGGAALVWKMLADQPQAALEVLRNGKQFQVLLARAYFLPVLQ